MVTLERICKDFGRITSDNVDCRLIDGHLGKDLQRLSRITSDNVDPGGLIDSHLGKDPQRLCKDYL